MDAWGNARQENGHMPDSCGVRPGAERPRRRMMPSDDGLAVAARPRERQAKAAGKRPMAWDRDPGVRAQTWRGRLFDCVLVQALHAVDTQA